MNRWILDADDNPVRELDLLTWARWFEHSGEQRTVARTTVADAAVSTVFLGIDHSLGHGPPLLYETMIFGGEHDEARWCYSTRAEAEAEHTRIVAALQAGDAP